MSLPSPRSSTARSAGLAVSALVSISFLILTPASSAAGAAPSPEKPGDARSVRLPTDYDDEGSMPSWSWPVEPSHTILRPFIAPRTTYSAGHRGIDIQADADALVTAVEAGVVHFAGIVVDRPLVSVRHVGGLISSVEPVTPLVVEGQVVSRGEVIGHVAAAHCARTCVHLGVRLHGEYVSPLKYLGGLHPAVLLPTRRLSD